MNMIIKQEIKDDQPFLTVSGEIDAYTEQKLRKALFPLIEKKGAVVTIDMEAVNYMDSVGLGLLISALKSAKENESQFKLINLQDRVLRLFEITGLDEIIDVNSLLEKEQ